MRWQFLFAFLVIPMVELGLLLRLGAVLGPWPTFGIVVLTGVVGASLARAQGISVLRRVLEEAQRGAPSGQGVAEGALVLIGGLLLLTPGVLTDALGFAMLLPPTRRLLAPMLLRRLQAFATVNGYVVSLGPDAHRPARPRATPQPGATARFGRDDHFEHPVAEPRHDG